MLFRFDLNAEGGEIVARLEILISMDVENSKSEEMEKVVEEIRKDGLETYGVFVTPSGFVRVKQPNGDRCAVEIRLDGKPRVECSKLMHISSAVANPSFGERCFKILIL